MTFRVRHFLTVQNFPPSGSATEGQKIILYACVSENICGRLPCQLGELDDKAANDNGSSADLETRRK